MIYSEHGEIDRFDRANQPVSYAGLDSFISKSGTNRHECQISKQGNKNLQWILYNCVRTAVYDAKDASLHRFYRCQFEKEKPKKIALVATARKTIGSAIIDAQEERTVGSRTGGKPIGE